MLHSSAFIAIIGLAATALPSRAQIPAGVYSSVRQPPETGDLLGDEIEIRLGPKPVAIVTLCEGDCYGGKSWPAVIRGDRVEITVQQDLVDQDGHPVKGPPIPLVGQYRGGALHVQTKGEPLSREVLKRVKSPKPNQTAQLACGRAAC